MSNIIQINNLTKTYGDITAVDNISFNVERGSLFAFLGINGAGKSTTINILCTLLQKDSGSVNIDGFNLDKDDFEIKKRIGIVFQNSILDESLSVKDNLNIRASYYGLRGKTWEKRLRELTDMLDLKPLLKRPISKLSGGQKLRVDIARGLINCPNLLFLDEPTTGLDPQTRRTIWEIIKKLQTENNMTVFLTTHYMEEAEKASQVVIIDSGKIIASDTPNGLKSKYSGDYIKLYSPKTSEINAILNTKGLSYRYENESYIIKVDDSKMALSFLCENSSIAKDFEVIKGNMDDVFLNATGKKLGE